MERIWSPTHNLSDNSQIRHTAIVSDLHLCEAEPINQKFPLWKKYKTSQFFFDTTFDEFLYSIQSAAGQEKIELIFNGDTFDFDSVCHIPESPTFKIGKVERSRGLNTQREKSVYKINKILDDHPRWVKSLRRFLDDGNRIIFIIGNHDLELFWPDVQDQIVGRLMGTMTQKNQIRFCEFFYISNQDTLVEHGHQYDPYCHTEDPLHPFVLRYNQLELKIPFGNLATRYMINAMGFFNPYIEGNYIMSLREYVNFFFRYIARAQPFLVMTWLWGATLTLFHVLRDRVQAPFKNPLVSEERIEDIARKANATPRMVRELLELGVPPASSSPIKIAKELWLDRAFLLLLILFGVMEIFLLVQQVFNITLYWSFLPMMLFVPFFIFYAKSVESKAQSYKQPKERVLVTSGIITGTKRVVYGHTHVVRHEIIGTIEHLNSGTWSPAFKDVECSQTYEQKTFIWLAPEVGSADRKAEVLQMINDGIHPFFKNRKNDLDVDTPHNTASSF